MKEQLVPELRFGEFEGEWALTRYSDLFEPVVEYPEGQDYPLYSLTIEDGIIPKPDRYQREHLVKGTSRNYKVIRENQFAYNPMNLRFGALKMHRSDVPVRVSKYYDIFRCKPNVSHEFANDYLTRYKAIQYYNKMATGSLEEKKRVHFSDFINFKRPYPTLPEQQKIATFLSLVDRRLAAARRRVALLEEWKQGVVKLLFKEIASHSTIKLGEISNSYSGGTPTSTRKDLYTGDIPFIKSGEIHQQSTKEKISREALVQSSAKIVKKGDLLYALYGANSGDVAISKINGAINQAILCIRSEWNTHFLYQYLLINKGRIVGKFLQGGQGNLSAKIIKSIQIPSTSLEEQTRIAQTLTTIDARITAAQKEVAGWEEWKRGLLQKMLV